MGENLFILLTPANAMDTIQILLWGDIFHFSDIACEKYKEKLYSCEPGGFGGLLVGFFLHLCAFPCFKTPDLVLFFWRTCSHVFNLGN